MVKSNNILITNSVAINGGDEALLRATIQGIKMRIPNAVITVLSSQKEMCNKFFDDIKFDDDWEYATALRKKSFSSKKEYYFVRIRQELSKLGFPYYSWISRIFANQDEKRINNFYKKADLIISSGGGYIHDIYGYYWREQAFLLALQFHKKLVFFGQSIGPFFKENNHQGIKKVFKKSKWIILRDRLSLQHLQKIGYNEKNIYNSTDIAFTLFSEERFRLKKNNENKKIVMCFRKWRNETENNKIKERAQKLITYLVEKGYSIDFVSTCQGIESYVDDSKFASEIIEALPETIKRNCKIIHRKFSMKELIEKYGEYDAYIGMRLHGAILSMIAATPAFNIAYEDKTKGIFEENNMAENQIWYSEDTENIINKVTLFLENLPNINDKLYTNVKSAAEKAEASFDLILT